MRRCWTTFANVSLAIGKFFCLFFVLSPRDNRPTVTSQKVLNLIDLGRFVQAKRGKVSQRSRSIG